MEAVLYVGGGLCSSSACVNFASDLQFTLDILPSVVVLGDFNVKL